MYARHFGYVRGKEVSPDSSAKPKHQKKHADADWREQCLRGEVSLRRFVPDGALCGGPS